MHGSAELLDKALLARPAVEWAKLFGVNKSTITRAKQAEKLSPALAGAFAMELNEPVDYWVAVAGLEQERSSGIRERVIKHFDKVRKL